LLKGVDTREPADTFLHQRHRSGRFGGERIFFERSGNSASYVLTVANAKNPAGSSGVI
jgi:hypothetical protein